MIWRVLGIKETKDKKAITRAYREQLSSVNPEEKPEEFKGLRKAYEAALKRADEEEIPLEEKSELDLWKEKLVEIYNNFQARIDVDSWKELMSYDICQGLDTRPQVEEALLDFMQEHFQLPQKVMCYLEKEFGFSNHLDELKERYSNDFIQYILIDAVRFGENLPMDMFIPGFDAAACDAYTILYNQIRRTPDEEAGELYQKMQSSPELHPYGESLLMKRAAERRDFSVIPQLEELVDEWPEDNCLPIDLAYVWKLAGNMEQMAQICEKLLDREPKHFTARQYMAEAEAAKGNYKTAIEAMNRLIHDTDGDYRAAQALGELRQEWNVAYAEQLKRVLEENPEDHTSRSELCWCYVENNHSEKAYSLAEMLPEGYPDAFSYYNLMAVLSEEKHKHEATLDYLEKLLEAIQNLQPDGTEKTERRIARGAEVLGRMAAILVKLKKYDEAEKRVNQSLEVNSDDMNNLLYMIQTLIECKKYRRAEEVADLFLQKGPRVAMGYYLKAAACFRRGDDSQAFQLVNTALELDGSELHFYLLKLRILMRNHAFEAADALIQFLADNGITDDLVVNFCKLQKYMLTRKETKQEEVEEFLQLAKHIEEQMAEAGQETPFFGPEFYYDYTELCFDYQRIKNEGTVDELTAILDKGIAMDPDDAECLSYKGWLLKHAGRYEQALEIYKKLEQKPDHSLHVEKQIAEIYYKDLDHQAAEALNYYESLLEREGESGEYHFYAGMCCMRMNRLEEACLHFQKEQELEPDDIDGYFRLAYTLQKMNRLEEALEQAQMAVGIAKKWTDENTVRFFFPLIRTYRRMNQPDKAIQAVKECAKYNPDWNPNEDIFEILLQFGRYAEADAFLKNWEMKQNREDRDILFKSRAKLLFLQGKVKQLSDQLLYFKKGLDPDRQLITDHLLAALNGDYGKYLTTMEDAFYKMLAGGGESSSTRVDYIQGLWMAGKKDKAREEAVNAIEILDQEVEKTSSDRLLYQTKRAFLLAVAGRIEESRAELESLKGEPMCENCSYCRCKDIEVFLAYVELIAGETQKALHLSEEGIKNWPDEGDFLETKYYIEHMMEK